MVDGTRGGTLQTLWRVPIDGNHRPEQITSAGFAAAVPAVARTHDRLAFSRDMNDVELYSFQPGRPSQAWLSLTGADGESQFSPDGRRVVFVSSGPGDTAEIGQPRRTSGAHQLTHGPGRWQGSPRFSPDGRQVAFGSLSSPGSWHIWAVDSDGGSPRQITDDAGDQQVPSWSRDGQWIYFSANSGHGQNIWRGNWRGEAAGAGFSRRQWLVRLRMGRRQDVALSAGHLPGRTRGRDPHDGGGTAQPVLACARTGAFLGYAAGLVLPLALAPIAV